MIEIIRAINALGGKQYPVGSNKTTRKASIYAYLKDLRGGHGVSITLGRGLPTGIKGHVIDPNKLLQGTFSLSKVRADGRKVKENLFPNRKISEEYREVLANVLLTHRIPDLSALKPDEKEHFYRVLALAQMPLEDLTASQVATLQKTAEEGRQSRTAVVKSSQFNKQKERMTVLIGSIAAGNTGNREIQLEIESILASWVRN